MLEYGALMSKWYDTVYTGGDLPSQSTNRTPGSNRSGRMSHLQGSGATGEQEEEIIARAKDKEKESKPGQEKLMLRALDQ